MKYQFEFDEIKSCIECPLTNYFVEFCDIECNLIGKNVIRYSDSIYEGCPLKNIK
jgi:hypothetical protein